MCEYCEKPDGTNEFGATFYKSILENDDGSSVYLMKSDFGFYELVLCGIDISTKEAKSCPVCGKKL